MPPKIASQSGPGSFQELTTAEIEAEVARRLAPCSFPLGEACVGASTDRVFVKVGSRLDAAWVKGDLRFGFPVHTWDAWVVLGALASEPVVRNRDGSIPQKWLKPVAQRMVPVPDWWGMGSHPEQRAMSALVLLDSLGALARQRGEVTDWSRWAISTKGSLLHRDGRVSFFQKVLESDHLAIFDPQTDETIQVIRNAVEMALWALKSHGVHEPGVGRLVKRRVLESLPSSGSALFKDILEAFAPKDPWIPDPMVRWSERKLEVPLEEVLDKIHPAQSERILSYAFSGPFGHGLMARGITSDGSYTWSLTEAGRRFLGLPPGLGGAPPLHAKVTAAYDVFFGRLDPAALAEVSLYAELTGADHGLVGRISRASCQTAFSIGISMTEIVNSLESMLAQPIPKNVRISVEDWARAAQPVKVRDGLLLECPDEDTAGILERMAKGAAVRVAPTVVFLADRKLLGALRKKASESGILI